MFRLFYDRVETHQYKKFYWKTDDGFFVRLWGLNWHGDIVEPIYQVGLKLRKRLGWFEIETPHHLIVLYKRKPFIHIERFTEWQLML